MTRLASLVGKDLRLIVRDRAALVFLLLAPMVVISVAGFSLSTLYGTRRHTALEFLLPVVDLDRGEAAKELIEGLKKAGGLRLQDVSEDEARYLVARTNRAGAALIIPEGFSESFRRGKPVSLRLLTDPVKHLEVLKIRAAVERARGALVALQVASRVAVMEVLTYAGEAEFEEVASDASAAASRLVEKSVVLEEKSLTSTRTSFNTFDQNVPGFGVTFLMLGTLFGVGLGLADEREWGMTYRLGASPVAVSSLVHGKVISRFAVGVGQMLILFLFGRLAFAVSLGRSPLALLFTLLAVSFAASAFGLLVAAVAPTRESVLPLGTIAVVGMTAIGGCWWPISIEPAWLQRFAHLFPPAWAMDAFNDLMLRERSLAEVGPALAALGAFGAIYLVLGERLYVRREERSR